MWQDLEPWVFTPADDGSYVVRVSDMLVRHHTVESLKDKHVTFQTFKSEGGTIIGYSLRGRRYGQKPFILIRQFYLGMFYSDRTSAKKQDIVYYDPAVRLLAYEGEQGRRNYLWVLRQKAQRT